MVGVGNCYCYFCYCGCSCCCGCGCPSCCYCVAATAANTVSATATTTTTSFVLLRRPRLLRLTFKKAATSQSRLQVLHESSRLAVQVFPNIEPMRTHACQDLAVIGYAGYDACAGAGDDCLQWGRVLAMPSLCISRPFPR